VKPEPLNLSTLPPFIYKGGEWIGIKFSKTKGNLAMKHEAILDWNHMGLMQEFIDDGPPPDEGRNFYSLLPGCSIPSAVDILVYDPGGISIGSVILLTTRISVVVQGNTVSHGW